MEFRLKKLRKARKISQLKLALDLNMNQNTISRYENMEREADYETLVKFADYFGVSLDYLLGRTDDFNKPTDEAREVISYYNQLTKLDKHWVVGQMIDLIKKYESEAEQLYPPVAAEGWRKASGK